MSISSGFFMWGERGLIATFFADLHSTGSPDAFGEFLKSIEIETPNFPRSARSVITIIEPDFSNTGFGHPDAVLRVEADGSTFVIVLEAKRVPYAKACKPVTLREVPRSGFNSSLNGQLELDFALALALERFDHNSRELVEPDWIRETPYATERRSLGVRRLKNPVVLQEVVAKLAGLPLEHYFFLAVTTDASNPLQLEAPGSLFPELYHPKCGKGNCWAGMHHQFGWVNYARMAAVIESLRDNATLRAPSLFLESLQMNRRNMDFPRGGGGRDVLTAEPSTAPAKKRGTSLIYALAINPATFLHFSWLGESCALRDYSKSSSVAPTPERSYRTSEVRKLVQREISSGRERAVGETSYWHRRTAEVNRQFLDS